MTDEQLTEEPPFIAETISWTNCAGIDITEYVPQCGEPPEGFARFRMQVTLTTKDGQPLMAKVVVIEAESLEEAFVMAAEVIANAQPGMEEDLSAHIKKQQEVEQSRQSRDANRIMTPSEARALAAGNGGMNRQQRRAAVAQQHRMRFNG